MSKVIVITGVGKENSLANRIAKSLNEFDKDFILVGISHPDVEVCHENFEMVVPCNLLSQNWIQDASAIIKNSYKDKIHYFINAAGLNYNAWLEDSTEHKYDEVMMVNSKCIYLFSKYFLEELSKNDGTILNIVSNAAHVPMRCSTAYNASKAAAKMITMQLARELTKKFGITVFSVSPNKLLGTGMSDYVDKSIQDVRGWSKEEADKYQNDALITGQQTDPDTLAEFIAFLLSKKERHFFLSGCDIPYGA